jgi:hypothetical protein
MGGPWEEYQTAAAPEQGPWSEYASAQPPAQPQEAPRETIPLPKYPGGLLQVLTAPIGAAMRPIVEPVNNALVSLAGGATKGLSKIGVIDPNDPVAQAGFDLTPQQLVDIRGEQIKEMTGSPWAGAAARTLEQLGPASPGSWIVPAVASKAIEGGMNAVTNASRAKVAQAMAQQAPNAERNATIEKLQGEGYAVPPSLVQNKSAVNTALESFGGKAALKQEATIRNQEVSNALARKDIGMAPNQPLSTATVKALKAEPNAVYAKVDALKPSELNMDWFPGYHDTNRLEQLNIARAKAHDLFQAAKTSRDPTIKEQAFSWQQKANAIESDMGRIAQAAGDPNLVKQFADARTKLAKIHEVERALNSEAGRISAPAFGKALEKKVPLTGNLKTIGEFDNIFPQVSRPGEMVPAPGVSATNAITSAMLAGGGYAAMGPAGIALAAAPALRGPVRNLILSKPYQKLMVNPRYAGLPTTAAAQIPPVSIDPVVAALLGRMGTLPEGGQQ